MDTSANCHRRLTQKPSRALNTEHFPEVISQIESVSTFTWKKLEFAKLPPWTDARARNRRRTKQSG